MPDPGRPAGLDRVDLLARAAEAAAFTGAVERAVALLEEALDRVDPAAEPVRAAVLLASLGAHRRTAGDEPGALAAHRRAEQLLAGTPPSAERAHVLASHALTLNVAWQDRQAIRYCEEAIAVAREAGARAEEARALDLLGACLDHEDPTGRSPCTGRPAGSPRRSATPRRWLGNTRSGRARLKSGIREEAFAKRDANLFRCDPRRRDHRGK